METIQRLNLEMEDFMETIPLGIPTNISNVPASGVIKINVETQTLDKDVEVTEKELWSLKETQLGIELGQLKKRLDERNSKPDGCKAVPAVMWGHQTMTWTRPGYVQPRISGSTSVAPRRRSSKSSTTKPNHNPKPFSIPFRPKALHLLVRKAYLKPPPKLPPLHSRSTFITTPTHKTTPSPKCSSLDLDSKANDAYELFADALERALNSNEHGVSQVHEGPMDDHQLSEDPSTSTSLGPEVYYDAQVKCS